jgi:nucleotide-binding universal stress UspA family protein
MRTWNEILAAIDFSDSSQDALRLAARLARGAGADLTLVHVRERPLASDLRREPRREEVEREVAELRSELARWQSLAERLAGRRVEALVATGSPVEEICRTASEGPFDAIVTGWRGRGALGRLVLGSVAARVVREAPCSVVVAPRGTPTDDPAPPARILCAVDFSGPSRVALREAADLARTLGSELELVHAFAPPLMFVPDAAMPLPRDVAAPVKLCHEMAAWEAEATQRARRAVSGTLVPGDPMVEILRHAEERGCDLLVVGTHGRTGVRRLLVGSVAESVIRAAAVPVLVVRQGPAVAQRREAPEEEAWDRPGRHDRELWDPLR